MDDAYQAGDCDLARSLIDEWDDKQVEKDEDSVPRFDDDGFEGPSAGKKERKLQMPSGRAANYDDILFALFKKGNRRVLRPARSIALGACGADRCRAPRA